jgi:hypothetical protein
MTRLVVVLGREAGIDMNAMVQDAWKARCELVVYSIGFPLTRAQNDAIDIAMEAAGRGALDLEARITHTIDDAAALIQPEDRVVLAIFGRERKRFERAVQRRPPAAAPQDPHPADAAGG